VSIRPDDRGLLLGDGVFETIRVEQGRPLLFERHLRRLSNATETLGFAAPIKEVRSKVRAALAESSDGFHSLRMTVTRGVGPRGLLPPDNPQPTVLVSMSPAGARPNAVVHASLSGVRRNAASPSTQIKSLAYLDNILARQQAAPGCEDVIMLNTDGFPACTSIGNMLALTNQGWVTPAFEIGGILPGIVREVLIEKGHVRETRLTLAEARRLPLARSNSLVGVQPLKLVDGCDPALSAIEQLTKALQAAERSEP